MQCPSCGADIKDPAAVFCPRCATPLGSEAGEATSRIDAVGDESSLETPDEPAPDTASLEPVESPSRIIKGPHIDVAATRARLEASGWFDAAAVAGLGFLVLLAIGAILVVAAKLNFPGLGAGGDLLGVFTAVVLAALGVLGIPIVVDGVAVSALPLGALAAAGWGFWWAASSTGRTPPANLAAAVRWGVRLALPVALLCWFFAVVFRFRGEHPVAADAGIALVAGAFWGAIFGMSSAAAQVEPLRATLDRVVSGVRARSRRTYEGFIGGATMLGIAGVAGAAAVLLWIIVALIRGAPGKDFGAGDAVAYLVYLAAFLPNVVVAVVSLAFGAPLEVGAKVDLGGRVVGPLRDYSVWQWGPDDRVPVLIGLIVIPLVACVWGGVRARRRADGPDAMLHVLLVASGVVAVSLTLLGGIARLRLAGVVKGAGYASVAPDPVAVFVLSFLVCGVLGAVGWKLAESSNVPALRGDE